MDADVKTFMGKIVQDPDKWIVWYAENLDPKIEGATEYGKAVAEAFKVAMHTKEPPVVQHDGGNGKSKTPAPDVSQPVSPPLAAEPGSIGGDGDDAALPSPAPDAPQVEAPAEATVEAPKVN
jgi:hypothetical protein